MRVKLIRNATMGWTHTGYRFLTDLYFAAKHTWPPFAGKSPNPQVDLLIPPATILASVETVLIYHLHRDHSTYVTGAMIAVLLNLPWYINMSIIPKQYGHLAPPVAASIILGAIGGFVNEFIINR